MDSQKLSKFFSIKANSILYRLKLSFGLFLLTPLIGFFLISLRYDILESKEAYYFVLAILLFSLFGYVIVRQIFEGVDKVAKTMTAEMAGQCEIGVTTGDELEEIENTFKAMHESMTQTSQALERRMAESEALRDLNHITFTYLDDQTLLNRSLEKAAEATQSIGGAWFRLEKKGGRAFLSCQAKTGKEIILNEGEKIPLSEHPGRFALESSGAMLIPASDSDEWSSIVSEKAGQIAVVPMTQDGYTGIAVMLSEKPDGWSNEVLNFLASYFGSMANALQIQALGRREQETAEDLKTVLYIIKSINSGLMENEMLLAIGKKLNEVIPHQWIGLALAGEGNGELTLSYSTHREKAEVPVELTFPETNSLFQTAKRTTGVLSVTDLSKERDHFERILWDNLDLKSCILAGLHFKGESIGVVCLASTGTDAFHGSHERIFSMIADGLSLAIEQARLLRQAMEKTGELELLNQVGRTLTSSTFNLDRVLTHTIEMISKLINVEAGSLLLLRGDELIFKVAIGEAGDSLKGLRIQMGKGIVGWVASTGQPILVRDTTDDPRFYKEMDNQTGFMTKNLLCIPMIVRGRTIGVIELLNKVNGTFTEEDLKVLQSVATSAAIAIENARLYSGSVNMAKKERLIRNIFQKYVPEEVVVEILGKGERDLITLGELRQVTLLNIDIRGYSHMSKRVSPENVVGVLNYFFMHMGGNVLKHKGILDKYLGDGLLAIFGAPVATRNPALDAVHAAIDMSEKMELVNRFAQSRCGVSLNMGISINTGEAIVGNIGFEKKMDYTAIGGVVNDTFRLQQLTKDKPNSILISESTFKKVKPFVQFNPLGEKTLGTNEDQMRVFEITGKKEMSDIDYMIQQTKIKEKQSLKVKAKAKAPIKTNVKA